MLVTDETATARGDVNGVVLLGSARGVEKSSDAAGVAALGPWRSSPTCCSIAPGGRATREEAGAFLWEKVDRGRQAGNLRQLLFRIRAAEIAADMQLLETTATRDRPQSAQRVDRSAPLSGGDQFRPTGWTSPPPAKLIAATYSPD